MEETLQKIKDTYREFLVDAQLCIEKGNKTAGKRSRKYSTEVGKLMKDWRKATLEV